MDEPVIDEKAVEALIEAEAEKGQNRPIFISEAASVSGREKKSRSATACRPPAFLLSFFEKRRTEFKEKVKTEEQAIGIDLGTKPRLRLMLRASL